MFVTPRALLIPPCSTAGTSHGHLFWKAIVVIGGISTVLIQAHLDHGSHMANAEIMLYLLKVFKSDDFICIKNDQYRIPIDHFCCEMMLDAVNAHVFSELPMENVP